MKGLSKGRYDETFAGEDDKTYARSKSFLSLSTPICQCLINNSYVSAQ